MTPRSESSRKRWLRPRECLIQKPKEGKLKKSYPKDKVAETQHIWGARERKR
jgi:hypothetical protein